MASEVFGFNSLTCGCEYYLEMVGSGTASSRQVFSRRCPWHREDIDLAEAGLDEWAKQLEEADR